MRGVKWMEALDNAHHKAIEGGKLYESNRVFFRLKRLAIAEVHGISPGVVEERALVLWDAIRSANENNPSSLSAIQYRELLRLASTSGTVNCTSLVIYNREKSGVPATVSPITPTWVAREDQIFGLTNVLTTPVLDTRRAVSAVVRAISK